MKKILFKFFIIFLFCTSMFFSFKVFIKFFFNDFSIYCPELKNLHHSDAKALLEKNDLKLVIISEDFSDYEKKHIFKQVPLAGRKIKKGRVIKVWVSKGIRRTIVPNFKGMDLISAKVLAEKKGLRVKNISYTHHKFNFNKIVASDPEGGTVTTENTNISFLVSLRKNQKFIYMPDVIGINYDKARDLIEKNDLIVGDTEFIYDKILNIGIVLDTDPHPGEKILPGTVVNLIVNKK